jgi:hypothetical protein
LTAIPGGWFVESKAFDEQFFSEDVQMIFRLAKSRNWKLAGFFPVVIVWLSLGSTGMADGLEGAFIWPGWYVNWDQPRWSQELGMMRDIGMDTVLVAFSVYDSTAYYPTKIPGFSTPDVTDSIQSILTDADENDMDVYLGLVMDDEWWSNTTEEYLDGLTAKNIDVATELYSRYSSHPSLKGFYLPQEVDNCRWADSVMQQRLVQHLLKPVSDHINLLDKRHSFCTAPFFNPSEKYIVDGIERSCIQPEEYEQWWTEIFNAAPHFDLVIPQDGIAAQPSRITLSVIEDYFTALKAACDATGRTLWSDLEVFEKVGVPHPPATPERILNQIAVEEPLVEKIVIWEWAYIAPHHSVRALDFYNNYQRHSEGKNLLENVSHGRPYSFAPQPVVFSLDLHEELADALVSYEYDARLGWKSISSATISLDLGQEHSLVNFRAYFLRDVSAGIGLPPEVNVSLSRDGVEYAPLGQLGRITQDDQSVNPYQIMLVNSVDARYVRYEIITGDNRTVCCEVSAYTAIPN